MPSGPAVLLAVDGGNSKTDVLLVAADGSVVGRARGAGSNHQLLGLDGAMDALGAAVAAAQPGATTAGPAPVPLGLYCLAGVDLPVDERRIAAAVGERGWSVRTVVRNDIFAVSRAGATSGWGIGVVCGAGINCAGLGPDGATVRFPSLGELSGDLAHGGTWLGVRALGLALRAVDGRGGATVLAERVPAHFALPDPLAVLESVYVGDLAYGRLFELAEVALDAAADGDGPARASVDELADEVVGMVTATIDRLAVASLPVEVVLGGGIFATRDRGFADRVAAGIAAAAPAALLRTLDAPPVVGAALLGLDELGAGTGAETRLRRHVAEGTVA